MQFLKKLIISSILAGFCAFAPTHGAATVVSAEIAEATQKQLMYTEQDVLAFLKTREVSSDLKVQLDKLLVGSDVQRCLKEGRQISSKEICALGFVSQGMDDKIAVYTHPLFPRYFFKFHDNTKELHYHSDGFDNCHRVIYAELIKNIIVRHGKKQLIKVPNKWVYFIPGLSMENDTNRMVVAEGIPFGRVRETTADERSCLREILQEARYSDALEMAVRGFRDPEIAKYANIIVRADPYNDMVIIDTEPIVNDYVWYRNQVAQLVRFAAPRNLEQRNIIARVEQQLKQHAAKAEHATEQCIEQRNASNVSVQTPVLTAASATSGDAARCAAALAGGLTPPATVMYDPAYLADMS